MVFFHNAVTFKFELCLNKYITGQHYSGYYQIIAIGYIQFTLSYRQT